MATRTPTELGLTRDDIIAAIVKHDSRADAARALRLNVNTVYKIVAEAIDLGIIPARPAGRRKATPASRAA